MFKTNLYFRHFVNSNASRQLYCTGIISQRKYKCVCSLLPHLSLQSRHFVSDNKLFSFFLNPSTITLSSYCTSENQIPELTGNEYEVLCNETLDSLCEYFEELIEDSSHLIGCDVTYSDGVLTVNFAEHGTYVINRQTPNKQIWLSSPTSGPKRYDFNVARKCWTYRHDNNSLHSLLQEEIPKIVKTNCSFLNCSHAG